jgi:CRISPR-associated protein Cas1
MLSLPDFKYKQIAIHISGGTKEKLRFRADNIIIENETGKIIFQHSCHCLFALFIIGETSLTTPLISNAVKFGFSIILMNRNMKITARINSGAEGNTLLRKKQYDISELQRLDISKKLIKMKIDNQAALLGKLRYLATEDKKIFQELSSIDVSSVQNSSELLGIEGNASRKFFNSYFRSLQWKRREPRCRQDINNLLLDIGYTYLFNFIEGLLCIYGFDIYCGVYHTFFYQRKSLVCDIIEPFRCIIDQRLRKAHNLKQIDPNDFFIENNQYNLQWKSQPKYIKLFMKDIIEEKDKIFKFCQNYYRWFIKEEDIDKFPQYKI